MKRMLSLEGAQGGRSARSVGLAMSVLVLALEGACALGKPWTPDPAKAAEIIASTAGFSGNRKGPAEFQADVAAGDLADAAFFLGGSGW